MPLTVDVQFTRSGVQNWHGTVVGTLCNLAQLDSGDFGQLFFENLSIMLYRILYCTEIFLRNVNGILENALARK